MARRAFLHLGTAKSGTTFLQELWWRHRDVLRERGLLLPGSGLRDHFHAAAVVKGMDQVVDELSPDDRSAWPRLLEESRTWDGDVLISHEHFSDSPSQAAARALADLAEVAGEVHVVITVRDLARVLPSAWQQRVKQGGRQPFHKFLEAVRDGGSDHKFWRYQNVPAIARRWSQGLPPERVHLVVVPGPGAPRDELWRRTAHVLGVDVSDLDTESRRPNESLGLVETELLRHVNNHIKDHNRGVALRRLTKGRFARDQLAGSAASEPLVLPPEHAAWVRARAAQDAQRLREEAYDVEGDLSDLVPADLVPAAGSVEARRSPEDVTTGDLLGAATTVVARMVMATTSERDGH